MLFRSEIRMALDQQVAADSRLHAADQSRTDQRWQYFLSLLLPLEKVVQDRQSHPEGDVLYHCLQVFELARERCPWDEDLLLAALLHDVGKGIDPRDHVNAGMAVLRGRVSERVLWLIENHGLAQRVLDGTAGARARRRLGTAEDAEALDLLTACDREGRLPGRIVCRTPSGIPMSATIISPQQRRPGMSRCPGFLRKNVTVSVALTQANVSAPGARLPRAVRPSRRCLEHR